MCVGLRQCAYVTGIYIGHAGSTGARTRLVSPAYNFRDSLPEWSKGVDSSSTSASCVGSNPTAVIYQQFDPGAHATMRSQFAK